MLLGGIFSSGVVEPGMAATGIVKATSVMVER